MTFTLEAARDILLDAVKLMPKEECSLEDCWQRVLAETIVSDTAFPPFDRSPLDGYALIAEEVCNATKKNPVLLAEIGEIAAGEVAKVEVKSGTACRIMTGAQMPRGATGVVRLEDLRRDNAVISILSGANAASNICFRGEEISEGEEVIQKGTVINKGVMGMLAVLGKAKPLIYRKPRVALIATGSEILPVESALQPGKIRNSNSYMLNAQTCDAGAQTIFLSSVKDEAVAIQKVLETAKDCELVITTGGASGGDYDLISDVFRKMGTTILFERVRMKPGMPVIAAVKKNVLYLGLSGNPAAAAMSFEQLVRPVLLKMSGRNCWWRPLVHAILTVPFSKVTEYKRFVWARCWQENCELLVEPLGLQSNGMLKSAMIANALIVIEKNSLTLPAGSEVAVMLLIN